MSHDLSSGVIDRFRSIDVRGETLTGGHVVASVLRNLCSTVIVLAVALAIGFRPQGDPAACLAAAGILVLYLLALSCFAAAIGILARSPEAAQGITFFVSFLPYASSAFVPIHTMLAGLRAFAAHQPVTAVANAIRELLGGHPAGTDCWHAVIWSLGILAASIVLAGVLFRRRVD